MMRLKPASIALLPAAISPAIAAPLACGGERLEVIPLLSPGWRGNLRWRVDGHSVQLRSLLAHREITELGRSPENNFVRRGCVAET